LWSSEQRRRALAERLYHLAEAVSTAKGTKQQLTEGLSELIRRLELLVPGIITDFDKRWNRIDGAGMDPSTAERLKSELCKEIEDLISDIGPLMLRVVAGGESTAVPVEIEACIQRRVSQATPRWRWTSILYASPEYNYSVERVPDPEQVLRRPSNALRRTKRDLVAFSLPRPERDAVGLHAVLLGHEIGHVRDWYTRVTERHKLVIPRDWRKPADRLTLFLDWGDRWISELVADIFACLTLGPVALLSLPEIMMKAAELDLDSETHPSPARRIELMIRVLQGLGYGAVPALRPILESYAQISNGAWSKPVDLAEDLPESLDLYELCGNALIPEVNRSLPALELQCTNATSPELLASPNTWPAVERASDLLAHGIPCGEDEGNWVDEVTILNAAWYIKAARLQELGPLLGLTGVSTMEDLGTLNAKLDLLALKSIEISESLRAQ